MLLATSARRTETGPCFQVLEIENVYDSGTEIMQGCLLEPPARSHWAEGKYCCLRENGRATFGDFGANLALLEVTAQGQLWPGTPWVTG